MNERITALENAICILKNARIDAFNTISDTGLYKVLHAENALNAQLAEIIAE